MDEYSCFAELSTREVRGHDYEIDVRARRGARVAVIAPHGGKIEPGTSSIAEAIAGNEFSLYCFNGIKSRRNRKLHITSHNFDEPECVRLVESHDWILAVHGCRKKGERVLLGGLDKQLIRELHAALAIARIGAEFIGHNYPGEHPSNICNRGTRRVGAQVELSGSFRHSQRSQVFVDAVRHVLMRYQNAA